MKKLFTLVLCILFVFALASCGDDPCQHRDADDNSLCDECGESYTDGKDLPDEHTHDYTVKNTDSKYLDKAADCENAATYFYSCSCGAKGVTTFTNGSANGHSYVIQNVDPKYEKTPASEYTPAVYWKSCACGKASTTETFTHGSALEMPVNSISLDKSVANIEVGDTVTLNVVFDPGNATDKNITWISSDNSIALVNNGIVVGVKTGTTTIIAMTANGKTATCLINVSPKTYYAESITLNKASVELPIGYTDTLTATVLPDYTTDKSVIWSSSDSNIVKVENGVITALSAGTVTITATTSNGKSATCTVKSLFIPATDIVINEQLIYVDAGENKAVNAATVPENATVTSLIWSSSDKSIATVNDGIITGIFDGIAVITVSTADGTISKSFNVVVENSAEIIYTSYGSGYSVTGINKCTETVIIPDTYKGKPVTSISANVFGTECRIIKKLYIGNNITTLPDGIFRNCTNLETLYVPNVKYDYIGDLFGSVQTEYIGTIDDFVNETLNGTGDWIYYGDSWLSVDGVYVYVEALHLSNNNILSWQSAYINGYYMSVPRKVLLTAYYIPKSLVNIYNKKQGAITVESDSACLDKVKDLKVSINGEKLTKTLAEVISLSDFEKIKFPGMHSLKVYYGGLVCEVSITVTEHTASAAVQENYVDSNCTEDGSYDSVTYCYSCNKELSRTAKTVDAKGHSPKAAVEENRVEASCTEDGGYDTVIYCSVCNDEVKRTHTVIQKKGHSSKATVEENRVEKTCNTDGHYDSVVYCGRCDDELSRNTITIPAAHTPKAAVQENRVEATCTEDGYYDSVVYCATCNSEVSRETKTITKLGHSPKSAVQENRVEATCTEDGCYDSVIYCGECNIELAIKNINIPKAHKFASGSCVFCGGLESSPGLLFTLNLDGASYSLTGKGSFSGSNLVIDIYNNLPVTSIGDYAFRDCSSLTSVTIGNSVTSIGHCAFQYCSSLTSVTIGNSVTSIGDYAFGCCSSLTSVTIGNSVTSIDYRAFEYCSSLTSITIPDSVTSIGDYAFSGCYKLVEVYNLSSLTITNGNSDNGCAGYHALNVYTQNSGSKKTFTDSNGFIFYEDENTCHLLGYTGKKTNITLPESCNGKNYAIYQYAFYSCDSLTSVTIGNSVTSIGDDAFYACSGLTSVTIPDSVTSIGDFAFYRCYGLTSVTIPESVASIGACAFFDCRNLSSIKYRGTSSQWSSISKGSEWNQYELNGYFYKINYTITYNYTGN